MNALDIADEILSSGQPDDEPRPRAIFFDDARLTGERGVTAARLHLPDEAEEPLLLAIDRLNEDTKTESRMLTHLARVRLDQNEPDEVVRLAIESLDVAQRTGSEMGISDIRTLRQELNPWQDSADVRTLDEALAVQI